METGVEKKHWHNGPVDWVQLTKVTCLGHITSSSTNNDQIGLDKLILQHQGSNSSHRK